MPLKRGDKKISCACGLVHDLVAGEVVTPKDVDPLPGGIGARAVRYADELTRWNAAGRPTRSEEEVERIYKTHCEPCRYRDGNTCAICRCRIGTGKNPLFNKIKMATTRCPAGFWDAETPDAFERAEMEAISYISMEQRVVDVRELASRLPPDINGVAGVPRSGMAPAAMLAELLHVPLYEFSRNHGLRRISHGYRFDRSKVRDGRLLILDDSICSGRTLNRARQRAPDRPHLFAALYVKPDKTHLVEYYSRALPLPHLFEWNMFNSLFTPSLAFDFDGIFCHDGAGESTLGQAKPLYLARRSELSLIVTWRMEHQRDETLAWMARWGIRAKKLIMAPYRTARRRDRHNPAEYKARHYGESPLRLFVESDPLQAEHIAAISRKPVLCPATGRIYR